MTNRRAAILENKIQMMKTKKVLENKIQMMKKLEILAISVSSKDQKSTSDARDSEDESDSAPELLQPIISLKEPNHMKRRRTPNDSEEDGTERMIRMRGLEDLGTGIRSKSKGLLGQVKQESVLPSDVKPNDSLSNGSAISLPKVCVSSSKWKTSQYSNQNESLKPKHRRRPLTKVSESTAAVSDCITCEQFAVSDGSPNKGLSEEKLSGFESHAMKILSADNNLDITDVSCEKVTSSNVFEIVSYNKVKDGEINSISDLAENGFCSRLFNVPLIEEDEDYAGFASAFTSYAPGRTLVVELGRQSDTSNHAAAVLETEGLNVSAHALISAARVNGNVRGTEKSGLEWQPKGKMNSQKREPNNELPQDTLIVHNLNPCVSPISCDGMQDFTDSSSLSDVKIEDEPSYKPGYVPLVSLMSQLEGKAIVGHPLTVEILEDGFCDNIINRKDRNLSEVPIAVAYDLDQAIKAIAKRHVKPTKQKSPVPPCRSSKSNNSGNVASLSKKTRRLSSLTRLKPGKKTTTKKQNDFVVACIPLKLVFSRIIEAMNGSSRQTPWQLPSAANT